MTTIGTVREWHEDEGWGVIDSPDTPGGCWTHFSHIETNGYRALRAGQTVALEWSSPGQDGFLYRAVRVWPDGHEGSPVARDAESGSFASTLSLSYDDPDVEGR
jgi:CspA family cold shock protein